MKKSSLEAQNRKSTFFITLVMGILNTLETYLVGVV